MQIFTYQVGLIVAIYLIVLCFYLRLGLFT